MAPSKLPTDFRLLFFAVWLTFWSIGVAVIQSLVLGWFSDPSALGLLPMLFLFTHGGSEALVQGIVSNQVREAALRPSRVEVARDVGGQEVRWRRGSPTIVQWLLTFVLPVVTLLILLAPAFLMLTVGGAALPLALSILFAIVWIGIQGWLWLPTWRAQSSSTDHVSLRVDAHRVTLTERMTTDTVTHVFPAHELRVRVGAADGERTLVAKDAEWTGRLPTRAIDLLTQSSALLDEARELQDGADVPVELDRLRRGRGDRQRGG